MLMRVCAEDAIDVPVFAPPEEVQIERGYGDGGTQDGLRMVAGEAFPQ